MVTHGSRGEYATLFQIQVLVTIGRHGVRRYWAETTACFTVCHAIAAKNLKLASIAPQFFINHRVNRLDQPLIAILGAPICLYRWSATATPYLREHIVQ